MLALFSNGGNEMQFVGNICVEYLRPLMTGAGFLLTVSFFNLTSTPLGSSPVQSLHKRACKHPARRYDLGGSYPSLFDDVVKCPNDFFHRHYLGVVRLVLRKSHESPRPTVVIMSVSKNYINICEPKTCKRLLSSFHDTGFQILVSIS